MAPIVVAAAMPGHRLRGHVCHVAHVDSTLEVSGALTGVAGVSNSETAPPYELSPAPASEDGGAASRQGQDDGGGRGPDEEAGKYVEGVVDTEIDTRESDESTREQEDGGKSGIDDGQGQGTGGGGR